MPRVTFKDRQAQPYENVCQKAKIYDISLNMFNYLAGGLAFAVAIAVAPARERQPETAKVIVQAGGAGCRVDLDADNAGTTEAAGNLTIAPTGDADFGFALSGRTLTGGENATTKTVYDAGSVNLTTNGVTASAPWGSGSTPQSVAQALAASVNNVAAAYWKASASGDVVTLTSVPKAGVSKASKSQSSASDPMGVTVTDSAGFAPPSFSATTSD